MTDLDVRGAPAQSLIRHLVDAGVAVTSTLTVIETSVPGGRARATQPSTRDMEVAFFRAGGLLVAGTDPTGLAAPRR